MEIAVLGIDLGKTVRGVAGLDGRGAVVFRRRIQRFRLLDFLAKIPTCVVAMEACGGAITLVVSALSKATSHA